ncbi:MAG: kynureninase [Candidatus Krumholzibacteria bacterium]|nr:kynureninase [Candidatus Krumholzibacteria bacterium]MDH4337733.1 kynureninase [Candidatus Krumholzibacteria bacterium]MDH5270639.1 kynureninase [Candidatus Krumholzibacteria bacterium]
MKPDDLYKSPNALAKEYAHFRVGERLLLSGHSHQAWPDVAFEGQKRAFLDAAEYVDDKWERAFGVAGTVRRGWARLLDDEPERVALGNNTHELVVRWLSALPLGKRPRLVTTDGEFHSIRRLVDRLAEEGIEVRKVPASPVADLAERLAREVDDRTAAAMVSSVLFRTAEIVPNLRAVAAACAKHGAELLVDAYHHLNIVPFSVSGMGLERAYITGGGYKYCQLGEGNSFLRFPARCALRPVATGWFSEFATKEAPIPNRVAYGEGPARFAGATYDPTSHYRAAEVFGFFEKRGLTPALLREVSQHQVGLLVQRFDALGLDPALISRDPARQLANIAGFLVLRSSRAGDICRALRERGVFTDYRGDVLRMGPAPYLCDDQIVRAVGILGDVCRDVR